MKRPKPRTYKEYESNALKRVNQIDSVIEKAEQIGDVSLKEKRRLKGILHSQKSRFEKKQEVNLLQTYYVRR